MLMKPKFRWRRRGTALLSSVGLSSLLVGLLATAAPAWGSPPWTTSQLVPPGTSGSASWNIAAVSLPSLSAEEVFWVPQNGSVQEKSLHLSNGSSVDHQIAPAGSADPSSDIVAVLRHHTSAPDIVDVFWVDPHGSIRHADNVGADSPYWTQVQPVAPAGSATSSASLAVVSRAPNTWELFWVAPSSGVEDAYSYDGGPSGRFQLAAPGSSTPHFIPRQITAVSRASNTMEVWWIGSDGSIQDRYYYDGVGWNGFTLAPPGSAAASTAFESAAITAVSRASNTMEVWWIGADNSVQDRYYFDRVGWNGFTLSPAHSAENAIASVAPSANAMNVTWTGWGSNSLQNASFPPWTQTQVGPAGPYTNGGIASVVRSTGLVDAFWVTFNGAIDQATN